MIPAVPPYDVWFKGLVGRFGWLDYGFPDWVYPVAGRRLDRRGRARPLPTCGSGATSLRGRAGELAVFAVMAAGLGAAIAVAAYQSVVNLGGEAFLQARYLLPLLPLYALFPALAVGALGRRRAPVVAVVLVAGVLAHGLAAQVQTLMRFYG